MHLELSVLLIALFPLVFSNSECQDGLHYCGSQVTELLGLDGYENNTLYRCHGGHMTLWSNCSGELCSDNACHCHPGRYYCGHELHSQFGWEGVETRPMEMFLCAHNGSMAHFNIQCQTCVNGDPMPTCDCRSGSLYCGSTLQLLGYEGYENATDTVYSCQRGPNGTLFTERTRCEPGFCEVDGCKCSPGKLYCGYELYEMGWLQLPSHDLHKLARCTNGYHVDWAAFCGNCSWHAEGSRCDCRDNLLYCGHELLAFGWKGYHNHTLYRCDGIQNATEVKICLHECHPEKINSFCIDE